MIDVYSGDHMGTTFVTLSRTTSGPSPGFWMNDGLLELWLRLLALHLPEPTDSGKHAATRDIRDTWLFASRGYCMGCVPHGLGDACATVEGQGVISSAIASLLAALRRGQAPLDAHTLNLLGIEGEFTLPIERQWLIDVGHAFLDLLAGKLSCDETSAQIMPGNIPYQRAGEDRGA